MHVVKSGGNRCKRPRVLFGGVTQDVFNSCSSKYCDNKCEMLSTKEALLGTQCLKFLLKAGYAGTLYLPHTIQTPKKKAGIHHKPHCLNK